WGRWVRPYGLRSLARTGAGPGGLGGGRIPAPAGQQQGGSGDDQHAAHAREPNGQTADTLSAKRTGTPADPLSAKRTGTPADPLRAKRPGTPRDTLTAKRTGTPAATLSARRTGTRAGRVGGQPDARTTRWVSRTTSGAPSGSPRMWATSSRAISRPIASTGW